ncbi:MAG: hypothetical protein NT062_23365 [Proteobacteria bacterium]|nr:hypothetical protein [Pseudomonadota bacterium]
MTSLAIGRALAVATVGLPTSVRARVLARIGGTIGEAARAATRDPAASSSADRARWAAAVRMPVPPGMRAVHPSWIEARLATLPPQARGAMVGQGHDRGSVWLARWACAGLATELPAELDLDGDGITRWLLDVGADQLAVAARAAGADLLAAIARRYPQLAPALERIARGRDVLVDRVVDERRLLVIGARCTAPHLVDPFHRRALALRLPRAVGVVVDDVWRAHAGEPRDGVPAWVALAPS